MPKNHPIMLKLCSYNLVTMNYIIPFSQSKFKGESITVAISNARHKNCLIVGLNYEILVEGSIDTILYYEGSLVFYLKC